jgi:hypothetical protein
VNGSALQLLRTDTSAVSSVLTNFTGGGPNENQTPRLVFRCYGNRRFLSEAWIGESDTGRELSTSSAERELAQNASPETNVILASR